MKKLVWVIFLAPWVQAQADICDELAALQADPMRTAPAVAFERLQAERVIKACTDSIDAAIEPQGRYLIQRGRGYLKADQFDLAWADWNAARALSYPVADFVLASAYLIADNLAQDLTMARSHYVTAYESGVGWSAQGLAMIYENPRCECFDLDTAERWRTRFQAFMGDDK
ncbi:hypothetical protein GH975_06195 [Litorivicinus lipolyticus]|uniref:Uncharacterized protein n=1 Tax=Litorivicinus lipolyticus TaxID=418701 RepID=A0A5Q2QDT4_9GAMM|nr:hypothetical protein [Litorivicinus lipolyticus]QGG80186.1 hypothetical protein GH975_06195 [Litorivicinus lipolyticus]